MTITATSFAPAADSVLAACSGVPISQSVAALLRRTFGVELSVADGVTGEPLFCSPNQPGGNWPLWSVVCRGVAARRRPEIFQVEPPWATLAVPLPETGGVRPVAIGVFVTREILDEEEVSEAAATIGLEPREAARWARHQRPWPTELLERVAEMLVEQLAALDRIRELEEETKSLSIHLAATYEEISLLYRITQNLKISKSDTDLGHAVLQWMQEVLPAEALAMQLVRPAGESAAVPQAGASTTFLSLGHCPVDHKQFTRLVTHLGLDAASRPRVANRAITSGDDWPLPEVRQLIVVPLAEGENLFGWLAAFNHTGDGEFGTVEASLLSSVGTILGIHSGNVELYRQQSEMLAGVVQALTSAIDAKDPYTCGHSDRVARVAVRIARELGMEGESLNTIYLSGLLHDIGKIGISDHVLRKPGKLTDSEYEHIKTHAEIGHRILSDIKKLDEVLPVVLYHHESWDGHGYPRQLPGERIPLSARIVAVADSFDAMSSNRPYRKGMPNEKIDEIFRAGAGKQWDPDVVDAFFRARHDITRLVTTPHDGAAGSPATNGDQGDAG